MANSTELIYGLYDDDLVLMDAVKQAKSEHLDIYDVYTPFPIHGLDPILGLAESRLHIAGFIYGSLGTLTAFTAMTWIFTKDWPIIFAGKPFFAFPSFVPIIFELTILFAAIGMVVSFYLVCGLGPGVKNPILDPRLTDDRFCIAFDKNKVDAGAIQSFFKETGALEINNKTI